MTLIFDSEFEREEILELITQIDNTKDKNIVIYFNSTGGTVSYAELLIDYINRSKKKIKIIAYYFIESCAFDFFVKVNCEKEVKDTCHIMIHLSKPTIDGKVVTDKARCKYNKSMKVFFNEIDIANKHYCDFYREIGIPEELVVEVEKGQDVIVPVDLMRKIIK